MTVISVHKDAEALTLTFVAEFDAAVERGWQLWEDPRQLEEGMRLAMGQLDALLAGGAA